LVRDHFAILKVGPGVDVRAARDAVGAGRHRRGDAWHRGAGPSRGHASRHENPPNAGTTTTPLMNRLTLPTA
jgi:hypothetical protein